MVAVTRNKGYGDAGEGGPGGDASQGAVINPNDSRSQSPQGSVPTVPAPLPIVNPTTAAANEFPVEELLFQGQVDDLIVCHALTLVDGIEVEGQDNINIAKPPQFRKSVIDTDGLTNLATGEMIDYAPDETSNLQGTRKREFQNNGGTVTLLEKIDPPYAIGDAIFASRSQLTGVAGILLIDTNIQARRWINIEPITKYYQIVKIERDTFNCAEWDFATNAQKVDSNGELLPEVLIAKTHRVRGSVWDFALNGGNEIDDVRYNVDGGVTEADDFNDRTATDDAPDPDVVELQEITPPWFENNTIIRARLVEVGTGAFRNGIQAIWQDTNDGARFAEKFA